MADPIIYGAISAVAAIVGIVLKKTWLSPEERREKTRLANENRARARSIEAKNILKKYYREQLKSNTKFMEIVDNAKNRPEKTKK